MFDIKDLYQEIIVDHNRNPRNFRVIAEADKKIKSVMSNYIPPTEIAFNLPGAKVMPSMLKILENTFLITMVKNIYLIIQLIIQGKKQKMLRKLMKP